MATTEVEANDQDLERPTRSWWVSRAAYSDQVADFLGDRYHRFSGPAQHFRICSQMEQLSFAFRRYRLDHGVLPPAYTVDDQGNPLHSWRVLLLPCLGQRHLYEQIRLDESWDSEFNRQFWNREVPALGVSANNGMTPYTVAVGEKTLFPGPVGGSPGAFSWNENNRALVLWRPQSHPWMSPDSDLHLEGPVEAWQEQLWHQLTTDQADGTKVYTDLYFLRVSGGIERFGSTAWDSFFQGVQKRLVEAN